LPAAVVKAWRRDRASVARWDVPPAAQPGRAGPSALARQGRRETAWPVTAQGAWSVPWPAAPRSPHERVPAAAYPRGGAAWVPIESDRAAEGLAWPEGAAEPHAPAQAEQAYSRQGRRACVGRRPPELPPAGDANAAAAAQSEELCARLQEARARRVPSRVGARRLQAAASQPSPGWPVPRLPRSRLHSSRTVPFSRERPLRRKSGAVSPLHRRPPSWSESSSR